MIEKEREGQRERNRGDRRIDSVREEESEIKERKSKTLLERKRD